MFDADKLPQFWLLLRKDYPSSPEKEIKLLLPFVTAYLCETGFSAVVLMKTKY
jgi:hypothetical protein